ncbi:flavodoxin family protein [Litorivivens lipolytica]|uniref:flavodoxin family protein n=1 Tax=Litorivivens lipolytica TaxID=1524264 RepID=UPI0031B59C48
MLKALLIVYHTQSGSSQALAEAAASGAAAEEGVTVELKRAMEADANDLRACDGVLFVTPENFGYLSGGMKDFFDRTYYPCDPGSLARPYMLIVSCGNDGSGAVRQLERIVKGYPLKAAAEPLIVRGEPSAEHLEAASDLGLSFAAGLGMGIF